MTPIGAPTGRFRPFHDGISAKLLILLLGAGACAAPADEPVGETAEAHVVRQPQMRTQDIDVHRSVLVTDLPTLEALDAHGRRRFSLERVLGYIAASSGDTHGLDAMGLYQRIFDVNNDKAHAIVLDGQHCDDEKDANGYATMNGFPIDCPRQEGVLADVSKHNPFSCSCPSPNCDPYTPVAIAQRFDLVDGHAQTCGQYRMVFAKGVGQSPLETAGNPLVFNRVLMILEAVLPNPEPRRGLAGCSKVMEFWAGLSKIDDPAERAEALDRFYFKGVHGLPPAFQYDHFSGEDDPATGDQLGGQIRLNLFMNDPATGGGGQMWQLRELNLLRTCARHGRHRNCTARVKMRPTRLNPDSSLFDESNQSARARRFRDPDNRSGFIGQVANLAQVGKSDINLINMNGLSQEFDNGQSTSSPAFIIDPSNPPTPVDDTNYNLQFDPAGPFAAAIQAELDRIGSPLAPADVVKRSQTQACAGCHELSTSTAPFFGGVAGSNVLGGGLTWPDTALGPALDVPGVGPVRVAAFTQISDALLLPLQGGVTCDMECTAHPEACQCEWAVSPALSDSFMPFRRDNMIKFLNSLGRGPRHDVCRGDD